MIGEAAQRRTVERRAFALIQGRGLRVWFWGVRLLPLFDARTRLAGGVLQMPQIGSAVAMTGLPLVLLVLVAKLKRSGPESAFGTGILPDADMDGTVMKFLHGLPAGAVGRLVFFAGLLPRDSGLCHGCLPFLVRYGAAEYNVRVLTF